MSYQGWNEAIGQHWFQFENRGKTIVLLSDSTFLETVANENGISLDGKTAQQHFIESVRQSGPWRRRELADNELPSTSAYLALAILAVSHMDSEIRQGTTSYWIPFNELYEGSGGSRQIPQALRLIWLGLWLDVKEWANEKNGGKYGIVRFPDHTPYGVRDPHKNIRFPKSQSLLKLEDQKRLTAWFDAIGLHPGESISRRWFANQIRANMSDASEFSVHSRRVFGDDLRFDAAVDQLLGFFADWDGVVWNPDSRRSTQRLPSRLVFAFRSNSVLTVGIQRLRNSRWTTESKHNEYPVSLATTPHQSRSGTPLAAVWCAQSRLFVQSKMIAANDRFLVFLRPPTYLGSDREKEAYANQFRDDLRGAATCVEAFASGPAGRLPGCSAVPALQRGWWMFYGIANGDLNESQLTSRTRQLFAPDIVKLRVEGGVKIDRKRWLAGAGPGLRIDGPMESGTIHCSTYIHDSVTHTSIRFENGRADPLRTNWPLDKSGFHKLWVVGEEGTAASVQVAEAKVSCPDRELPGWLFDKGRLSSASDVCDAEAYVSGATVVGEPFCSENLPMNWSRELIDTIVAVESATCRHRQCPSKNPLVTQLRRVAITQN